MLSNKVELADIYLHVRYNYTVEHLVFLLTVPTSLNCVLRRVAGYSEEHIASIFRVRDLRLSMFL